MSGPCMDCGVIARGVGIRLRGAGVIEIGNVCPEHRCKDRKRMYPVMCVCRYCDKIAEYGRPGVFHGTCEFHHQLEKASIGGKA